MSETTLYRLVNPPFQFEWNGKTYEVKKANLMQVVSYQTRVKQLLETKEDGAEAKIAAYVIYLMIKDQEQGLTEQMVMENTSGTVDLFELLVTLGFAKPMKETAIPEVKP